MTLPINPGTKISIADIRGEFGATVPDNITEYYRGGANVPNTTRNRNIPTGGKVSWSDYYGASKAFVFRETISTLVFDYRLCDRVFLAGWNGTDIVDAEVTVTTTGAIVASSTLVHAFETGNCFPEGSILKLINNGVIAGRGGEGGRGSDGPTGTDRANAVFPANYPPNGLVELAPEHPYVVANGFVQGQVKGFATAGQRGGPSILVQYPIEIDNTNGIIGGGGGGGGGGGNKPTDAVGGGGGHGGAAFGLGGRGGLGSSSSFNGLSGSIGELAKGGSKSNFPSEYRTPGTYIYTVPPGVNTIVVDVFGAGGGPAYNTCSGGYCAGGAGGGGAGGFSRKQLTVTTGQTFTLNVGLGGKMGIAGGSTTFDTMVASGGQPGSPPPSYAGGNGGTATGGDTNLTGLTGSNGISGDKGGVAGFGAGANGYNGIGCGRDGLRLDNPGASTAKGFDGAVIIYYSVAQAGAIPTASACGSGSTFYGVGDGGIGGDLGMPGQDGFPGLDSRGASGGKPGAAINVRSGAVAFTNNNQGTLKGAINIGFVDIAQGYGNYRAQGQSGGYLANTFSGPNVPPPPPPAPTNFVNNNDSVQNTDLYQWGFGAGEY